VQMAMEYVSSSPTITVKGAQIRQTDHFNSNQNRLASHPAGIFLAQKRSGYCSVCLLFREKAPEVVLSSTLDGSREAVA
jgi:hypothetical protein